MTTVTGQAYDVASMLPAPSVRSATGRRGRLVVRALILADLAGLALAFAVAELLFRGTGSENRLDANAELFVFLFVLPLWVTIAFLAGMYDRDERRADHTTVDDLADVFRLVAGGVWLLLFGAWVTRLAHPNLAKLLYFSWLAVVLVTFGRALGRGACRRASAYLQNTLIVGAGDVGQLVARKVRQHPEYRLNVVGFVDGNPKEQRLDMGPVEVLGAPDLLVELIRRHDVGRVIFAFSSEPQERQLELIRLATRAGAQVDIVPRLFEAVGPNVELHAIEGLPLVGIPAPQLLPLARWLKRAIDIVGAAVGLIATAPLFACVAWRIRRTSPGPVFFRQTRLGLGMKPFTVLKFRTMGADTDDAAHRAYVRTTMTPAAAPEGNGLYKPDRGDDVTPTGRWLRRTSLDELPQLINVLRGDMSLVGPRPCIPYEVEHYEPRHFDRFLVPAGLTGLWQVTARARSTYAEALEMDVVYARSWSLGLDCLLLLKTPFQLVRRDVTA